MILKARAASHAGIAAILAALAMVGPFSINTYLPSFSEMEVALHTNRVALQQTVSIYFASFAFMALWHGAISDSIGRRRVVLAGLAVYAAASLGCALANRVELIWYLRAFHGFSAGAGIVIGRAVIRDLLDGPLAQRMMARVVLMYGLAPAIAPLVGGWLQAAFGWRSVFLFLSLLAGTLFAVVMAWLPETLPAVRRQPFRFRPLLGGYRSVVCNRPFMAWACAYACMFGGFFLYVLSSPVFLMRHLGVAETGFLWLFGPATAGLTLGAALSGRLAARWSQRRTLAVAFAVMAFANAYNLVVCALRPEGVAWYVAFVLLFNTGMSMCIPILAMRGLDCVPERRGMGSSVQLFIQTGANAVVASVLAPLVWGSLLSLALGSALLSVLAGLGVVAAWRLSSKQGSGG